MTKQRDTYVFCVHVFHIYFPIFDCIVCIYCCLMLKMWHRHAFSDVTILSTKYYAYAYKKNPAQFLNIAIETTDYCTSVYVYVRFVYKCMRIHA